MQHEPQQGMNCERSAHNVNRRTFDQELHRWICMRSRCRTPCWSPAKCKCDVTQLETALAYMYNTESLAVSSTHYSTLVDHAFLVVVAW